MSGPTPARGRKLRRGYTTGMCAAAAAKGAVTMLFYPGRPEEVEVVTPGGQVLKLKLCGQEKLDGAARCCVIKDGGDDPDVTSGLAICAEARPAESGIRIAGGKGVGVVTRPGLPCPPGQPAINPVPRKIIEDEVGKVLPAGCGVEVTVYVPDGEAVAARTMNPRLGIEGGISILGTTGIVEPMSEEAFKSSLALQISQAVALGYRDIVLTPGRRSERLAVEKYGLPTGAVAQMSNFVGYMLEECVRLGVRRVMLVGHLGKLVKVAAGIFNTHSRVADARIETIVAHAALAGAGRDVLRRLWRSATVGEAAGIVREFNLDFLFDELAAEASRRAEEYVNGRLLVGTVLTFLDGEIMGLDRGAVEIGEALGWRVSK